MTQRLKNLYFEKVQIELQKQFAYKNIHQIPAVHKIVLNRGITALPSQSTGNQANPGKNNNRAAGKENTNSKDTFGLQNSINEFTLVTAQKPMLNKAKTSIAGFKVREDMPIGLSVTLRGEKMYAFLDRLINLALPRQRDFQGLKIESFDGHGNYTLGLTEQLLFPEIQFDSIDRVQGMDISIVTTAHTNVEGLALLKQLGMPFRPS